MTNLQAIDLLKGLEQSLDDYCELNDEGKTAFRMAITALEVFGLSEQLPSAQPEPQWISCSERLPEEGERVFATHLGGLNPERQVIEHIYLNGEFTCGWDMDTDVHSPTFGQRYMGKVIAWMPLPEPYAERRTDD